MIKITLASSSHAKSAILNRVHLYHECLKPICEEISNEQDPYKYVMDIAKQKLESIEDLIKEGLIISLDCIVLLGNQIVTKPHNIEEAETNIRKCSNNFSKIITGIAIKNIDTKQTFYDYQESTVYFKPISKEDIAYYIAEEKDILNVSGYVIENIASNFIKKIDGSFYNILGVPVEKIYEILNKMNIHLKDIVKR